MSVKAYPMIEKEFEGDIWKKQGDNESFSLYALKKEDDEFLTYIDFFEQLNEECGGYTEVAKETVLEYLKSLRPEERFRIKELSHAILTDIGDGNYIQYNVG